MRWNRSALWAVTTVLIAGCLESVPSVGGDVFSGPSTSAVTPPPDSERPSVTDGLLAQWSFHEPSRPSRVVPHLGTCAAGCILTNSVDVVDFVRTSVKATGYDTGEPSAHGGIARHFSSDEYLTLQNDSTLFEASDDFTITVRLWPSPHAWPSPPDGRHRGHNTLMDTSRFRWSIAPDGRPSVSVADRLFDSRVTDLTGDFYGALPLDKDQWSTLALRYRDGEFCHLFNGRPIGCHRLELAAHPDRRTHLFGVPTADYDVVHTFAGAVDTLRWYSRALNDAELARLADDDALAASPSEWPAPCAEPNLVGCADPTQGRPSGYPGISACVTDASAPDWWRPELDAVCADGWRVCTMTQVLARTSNRVFLGLGDHSEDGANYRLSESGCTSELCPRFDMVNSNGDSCGCDIAKYRQDGLTVGSNDFLNNAHPAAGQRDIHPPTRQAGGAATGVLCCEIDACSGRWVPEELWVSW